MMTVSIIENPGLIILHDWEHIRACLPIVEWQEAVPDYPVECFGGRRWPILDFEMHHSEPVSIFIDNKGFCRQRIVLTGVGLFRCAISLKGEADSFIIEEMVERIFGQHSDARADAEDFLSGMVPYLAREAGALTGSVPGDCGDRRGYLSTRHEREVWGPYWEMMFGRVGCNGRMPEEWHRLRAVCLDRLNLRVDPAGD